MTDASYSHKFVSALADSLGWNPEAVQKALTEIAQLQKQTQELELSVQGKAPTNHASKHGVFGLADELMYGHVKIAHEVSNDSTDGIAVSPDAVYQYADPAGYCVPYNEFPPRSATLLIDTKISALAISAYAGSACLYIEIFGTLEAPIFSNDVICDLSKGTFWRFYSTPIASLYFENAKFRYKNNVILANTDAPAGTHFNASFIIPLIAKAQA